MEITKATWTDESGTSFDLAMSISKVDQEKRLVYGWATLDNVDLLDDIVTFEASQNAFAKFKGNIREMHQPIAAGRMVEYRPQQYTDEDGQTYNGIFMSSYVSKGAPSTWEKVLDGTLSSFSVRGKINKSHMEFRPELGKTVRVVEDYTMTEVSLVDAGGNQFANLVSIVKDATGGGHIEGELANVEVHNLFLCKDDRLVEFSTENSLVCQNGHEMKNIGWFEDRSEATMEKVNALVQEHISKNAEGGVDGMADEVKKEESAGAAGEAAEALKVEGTEAAAVVDEAAGAEEVKTDEEPKEEAAAEDGKAADELEKTLTTAIEELRKSTATTEQVEQIMKDVDGKFEAFQNEFSERFSKLEEQQAELTKSLTTVTEGLSTMSKSVDGLQADSATRKSGDLGGEPEGDLSKSNDKDEKSGIWQGSILF